MSVTRFISSSVAFTIAATLRTFDSSSHDLWKLLRVTIRDNGEVSTTCRLVA